MRIELEHTGVDPRIFDVTIDFTGYPRDIEYFPVRGKYLMQRERNVPHYMLDDLLKVLKLRRIGSWCYNCPDAVGYKRINIYTTTVISDRMNKRNDVG